MTLSDLPPNERPAAKWAQKRLVMDLLTMVVWPHNKLEEDKNTYLNEVVGQANALFGTNLVLMKDLAGLISQLVTQFHSSLIDIVNKFVNEFMIEPLDFISKEDCIAYMVNHRIVLLDSSKENRWQYFLHSKVFDKTSNSDKLLMFGNETLQKILLLHFYASAYMLLRDEQFLMELDTTTPHMLSHIAVGVEYSIDKAVEEASGSAGWFHDLHNRGIHVLRAKSGLLPLERLIYVPDTMEQLVRLHQAGTTGNSSMPYPQSSSASAVPQMPVQEGLQMSVQQGSQMSV
ncbi:hypothetical protein F4604DRAFT_1677296 [Suillus subluteus]|nr:hypothetical protein F4604DRAFT_1677296 [Suillus subluteus]